MTAKASATSCCCSPLRSRPWAVGARVTRRTRVPFACTPFSSLTRPPSSPCRSLHPARGPLRRLPLRQIQKDKKQKPPLLPLRQLGRTTLFGKNKHRHLSRTAASDGQNSSMMYRSNFVYGAQCDGPSQAPAYPRRRPHRQPKELSAQPRGRSPPMGPSLAETQPGSPVTRTLTEQSAGVFGTRRPTSHTGRSCTARRPRTSSSCWTSS